MKRTTLRALALAGLLLAGQAAAAPATDPFFYAVPRVWLAKILPATASAYVSFGTMSGANNAGARITSLVCTSTDSVNRVITLSRVRSSTTYILGAFTVLANSGTDGTVLPTTVLLPTVLGQKSLDADGNYTLGAEDGDVLEIASLAATITAAKEISCEAAGGSF